MSNRRQKESKGHTSVQLEQPVLELASDVDSKPPNTLTQPAALATKQRVKEVCSGMQPSSVLDAILQVLHLHQRRREPICSACDVPVNSHQKFGPVDLSTPGACDQAITAALNKAAATQHMLAGQEPGLHITLQGQGLTAYPTSVPTIVISCPLQHFSMVPADTAKSLCWLQALDGCCCCGTQVETTIRNPLCDQVVRKQRSSRAVVVQSVPGAAGLSYSTNRPCR